MLEFGLFVTLFMGGAMTIFMNYISVHAAKLQLSPEILFYAVYCALFSIVLELFILNFSAKYNEETAKIRKLLSDEVGKVRSCNRKLVLMLREIGGNQRNSKIVFIRLNFETFKR